MSMQPYDIKTYGRWNGYDNGSSASAVTLNTHVQFSNISSSRGPAPYREYRPHNFLKVSMRKLPSWTHYQHEIPGGYYLNWSGTPYDYSAQMAFDPLAAARSTAQTDAYNRALNSLNDRVRGNTDLSIDLAQGSKTIRLGHDVAKVIRSIASIRNPVNMIKMVGNARLTWVYGIKPTLQSIYDAATFEARHYNNEFAFSEGKGKDGCKGSATNTGAQWPDYTFQTSWRGESQVRTKIGIILRIPDTPATQLARLTSLNPVSIAWELVPFSFVIDWFVNIGGYLRDLETALAYSSYFVRGFRTDTTITEYHFSGRRNYYFNQERWTGEAGIKMTRKTKARSVLSSYPMPSRPIFNANLGSGRLLNGAALLTVFLGKNGRKVTSSSGGSAMERGVRGFAG